MTGSTLNIPTFETIGAGGLEEDFNDALAEIAMNIINPNTSLDKRVITVKIAIEPDSDRNGAVVEFEVLTKLGKRTSGKDRFHIGRHVDGDKNKRSFYRHDERQQALTFDNVVGKD